MKKLLIGLLVCLIVVTGIVVFTNKDKDSGSSGSSYSGSSKSSYSGSSKSSQSHTCYVCGASGNHKYGSHYYCATHWAMVKTVAEAD